MSATERWEMLSCVSTVVVSSCTILRTRALQCFQDHVGVPIGHTLRRSPHANGKAVFSTFGFELRKYDYSSGSIESHESWCDCWDYRD